ncbi:MoaD/ThiS family protein [Rathayibacter iranicus]|uniref:Molybdopterin synthase sulfur carrier subunit n=2 Tax=Rathayibacter iranicus TaxID=59737 RepID=A0AAD1ABR6_9MICO|nr:MoaD/ThiS family protein [Rathayibacter iranicus]AZZ55371.1 molybdopterin synthase sulfur carrier subunit [Rathayibacter iranicus]MWV30898.1 MoaD/ThiS family protein [Rathayibacter iranicus NCPPB 2253 = VKM Ac-1602]PPI48159.1 molybdopterin synthase sulfur carrier subunit [Rathayibacter iranicus]PPI61375.1 molybdopterin synthase sulfur carrier subunit [Rathayibacter iranicus]PPI72681.1 molybdopterin synthase sulfur carrier subunit [Rathayibacter iranicus]
MSVRVRYFAAAKAALGRADDDFDSLTDLAALEAHLVASSPAAAPILARCTFLVSGVSTTDRATPLPAGASVDVLPPFAGG